MPEKEEFDRIRFELNILHPGDFWIDDVKIEVADDKSAVPADS